MLPWWRDVPRARARDASLNTCKGRVAVKHEPCYQVISISAVHVLSVPCVLYTVCSGCWRVVGVENETVWKRISRLEWGPNEKKSEKQRRCLCNVIWLRKKVGKERWEERAGKLYDSPKSVLSRNRNKCDSERIKRKKREICRGS